MFWLGLLLPIIYIAGYTGVGVPTQWALLSLMLPPLIWRRKPSTAPWGLGLVFIAYATLSLLWAPQLYNAIYGLWIVVLWGLSFVLGTRTDGSPVNLYQGLALGMGINSIFAIIQWFGYFPIHTFLDVNIAGLLFNQTLLSASAALVILGLVQMRLYHYIPLVVPSLILSGSRGGPLILTVGLLSKLHWAAPFLVILPAIYLSGTNHSDLQRLEIWGVAFRGLTWFGWSTGSFSDAFYTLGNNVTYPEFVHNDYLQLTFEYGAFAIIPPTLLVLAWTWRPNPTLYAVSVLAGFYFPLYAPITAFLATFWVGYSLRGFSLYGLILRHCRPDLLLRGFVKEPADGKPRSAPIPVQPRSQA